MVASINRTHKSETDPSSKLHSPAVDNLETKDPKAVAASMADDPFRYYAERDAGIATPRTLPVNPKDPFSFYYGQEYEAEQEAAAQAARERAAEIQAKYVAPAPPPKMPRPRADAEISMNLGAIAIADVAPKTTPTVVATPPPVIDDPEEHPLQRWGRTDREAREAANQRLQQGVTQLKDAEEETLANGQNRLWFITGLVTLTVLVAAGAYFIAPKILERQAAREANQEESTSPESIVPTASGDRPDTTADQTPAANSTTTGAIGENGEGALAANGTVNAAGDRRGSRSLDPDDVRNQDGDRTAAPVLKRDEILAPLGLNGGNFASWWRGEPVNPEGGSRPNRDGEQEDEDGVKSDFDSTDLEGDSDNPELNSEGSGLQFGAEDEDSDGDRQSGSNSSSDSGGRVTNPDSYDSYDSSESGDDGDYAVPEPGGGLMFGGESDSGQVPASMTNETVQLSLMGITNAIPEGIDAPVQNNQRVGSYRVTDTYLPCESSDASDCRDVHPVYGYHSVPHMGVDVAMPNGAPIFAVGKQGSTVTVSCYTQSAAGLVAEMSSSSMPEYEFKALHLSDCIDGTFDVGTIVAAVGASGGATGPHLHWEAFYNGTRVDPPRWSIEYAIKGNITREDAAKFTY